ncbi:trypsin-like peptidase domain-containing protein [Asanoa sp. WMMD1127]|uniref:S1C family serine protease n=1 Tax=Asanoa sp. WMMD1127 TaxID=3016107 RepID=UPI0024164385|nr:trypsin-like peptidase domain-containing protein [Asanoa sp. WMMD1127]MDG4823083.1 trypsin-like peptidase domain-containing protein [Asanoa sp. WMMD1127]
MTEHESDPRRDPERGTEPGAGTAPAAGAAAGAEQPTEQQPRPYGADQPTAQQPTLPTESQPVSGAHAEQPRSPWQPAAQQPPQYPQAGSGYPHYTYPGYGQGGYAGTHQQQHGTPIPWAGGGPGGPPAGPPWQQHVPSPGDPRRPNKVGRWIAAAAVALVLLLGAGLVGGVIGAALNGNDADNARARAAAAPVVNRSSLAEIAQKVEPSIVSITTGSGEGSGVVLTDDGYVLTNNHVVASASGNSVTVVFDNGKRASATIVGTDPKSDLAVVKASGVSGLSAAKFGDSAAVQVGDTVLALGSPLGLQGSVTAGIISAKDRTIRTQSEQDQQPNPFGGNPNQQPTATSLSGLLQTDAPINPGNSGGALVNTNGEVIGINTAIATSGQGNGSIGVGFAIPSAKAEQVAQALRNGEKVSHAALGVQVTETENGQGALVGAVTPNSAAAKAGLQQGDVITNFGGEAINTSDELVAAVQSHKVGDQVQLTYTRNGSGNTATVTLTEAS